MSNTTSLIPAARVLVPTRQAPVADAAPSVPTESVGSGVPSNVKALQRFMSFIPGGCFKEISYGIKEMRGQGAQGMSPHHVKDGIVDLAKGIVATGTFIGRGPIFLAALLKVVHATVPAFVAACLPIAIPIVGFTGLVETSLDGGRDLYFGIKDKNWKEAGFGAAKTVVGALSTLGLVTVNPLLIAAGPIMYLGLVGLQNMQGVKEGAQLVWNKIFHRHPETPESEPVKSTEQPG